MTMFEFSFNTLEVNDVKKSYIMDKMPVPALRGVTFQVEEGEFIARGRRYE